MLSIGEFSKICLTTTKTLRYYDEIGLIKPIHINEENGYRYYGVSQLKTMLTINKLKQYEFSLEEIAEIISDASDEVAMRLMNRKQRELQDKKESYTRLLAALKADINHLKEGISMMSYLDKAEVKLADKKAITYVFSRQNMGVKDYNEQFETLYGRIAKEKLTIAGAPFAICHDKEFNPEKTDIELGVPVAEAVKGTKDLPASLCATIRLNGPYSELAGCYAKLTEWIEKEGYTVTAPPYEIYLTDGSTTKPEENITEIHFPVKKK